MTSGAKSDGRFGKQDFVYIAEEDVYRCPAGERLTYRYTNDEDGKVLRRYWTTACPQCPLKSQCTKGPERRIARWEHEHVLEAVQQRLDANPKAMRRRRETVEHPFGTMKARMGATHFLTKTLPKVAAEMGLSVLAYNLTRHEHSRHQAADGGDRGLRHQLQPLDRASETLWWPGPSARLRSRPKSEKCARNGCVAARLANCCPSTPPPPRYHTWGNSGIEPQEGTANQLSREPPRPTSWRLTTTEAAVENYVGLDVSLKLTAICIVDGTGKIVREGMVASNPEVIAAFIKSHAPHVVRIGLEAGATSTWLWTELNMMGLPVICIDARHAKAALKMQINKSDRNDAFGIARNHAMWLVQGGARQRSRQSCDQGSSRQ